MYLYGDGSFRYQRRMVHATMLVLQRSSYYLLMVRLMLRAPPNVNSRNSIFFYLNGAILKNSYLVPQLYITY
jgi:hypothetical protein